MNEHHASTRALCISAKSVALQVCTLPNPSSGPCPCASLSLGFLVWETAVLVPRGSYPGVGGGACEAPGAQRAGRRG